MTNKSIPDPGITIDASVTRILDGDTIETTILVPLAIRVRLIDCWAPETRTTDPEEKTRGLEAKEYLSQMLGDREVRLHVPGHTKLSHMMTFGRVLGQCWLLSNGEPLPTDISERMVQSGHATATKETNQ